MLLRYCSLNMKWTQVHYVDVLPYFTWEKFLNMVRFLSFQIRSWRYQFSRGGIITVASRECPGISEPPRCCKNLIIQLWEQHHKTSFTGKILTVWRVAGCCNSILFEDIVANHFLPTRRTILGFMCNLWNPSAHFFCLFSSVRAFDSTSLQPDLLVWIGFNPGMDT